MQGIHAKRKSHLDPGYATTLYVIDLMEAGNHGEITPKQSQTINRNPSLWALEQ